jgi:hypothetical protein
VDGVADPGGQTTPRQIPLITQAADRMTAASRSEASSTVGTPVERT